MTEDSNVRVSSSNEASVSNGASQSRQRKKRKWDQPAESLVSAGIAVPGVLPSANAASLGGIALPGVTPISSTLLTNPLAASCAIMPQISVQQNGAAAVQKLTQQKLQDELIIAREIVINDAESSVRYKLTKRQTQEEIQRCTGAVVITRGKYRPPNAQPDGEKPLYLHISAGAHIKETAERILAVDRAAAMVEEMLKQGPNTQPISSMLNPTMTSGVKVNQLLSTCVFLGFDVDPSLNIVARIRGPNDQYINHIMNETGVTVVLRGHGSGNNEGQDGEDEQQPLHLFLSSNNAKSLEDAKRLAENLLDTISVEFGASRVSSCKVYSAVPPPQQVYSAVLPPKQVYGASPLSHPIASAIPPPQQVYSAVPPPQQLLAGVRSADTDLMASTSVTNSLMPSSTVACTAVPPASYVEVPGATHPLVPGTPPQSVGFLSSGQPQVNMLGYAPPLISGATSYIGYGGIYPQATPLQQVALALRKSPPVASTVIPTVSASNGESKSTTSSDLDKEKRPTQKRKFQELPVSSKGSTKHNQGLEPIKPEAQSDELIVRNVSTMPAPKKLIQPSSDGMPPPQPRSMPPPPPPPKFSAPSQVKVHDDKGKVLSKIKSSDVPDTLVKLMEYGDEDDDLDDPGEEPVGHTTHAIGSQKPFWAL